uniref:Uncharacterized protein n=1 Tax=Anguilla anguilla TaxID=7936 RepID=A0A0E9P8E5_ANGAN
MLGCGAAEDRHSATGSASNCALRLETKSLHSVQLMSG